MSCGLRKKRLFYGNQFTKKTNITPTDVGNEVQDSEEIAEPLKTSFNWRPYLRKPGFTAATVSCFKHVALSNCWDSIVSNVRVEVRSPDCKTCCPSGPPCCYWLATVIKVYGYWGLLRYDGFDKITPHYLNVPDKWFNLCTEPHIHPIGWCAQNGKYLVPPKNVEPKIICWRDFLLETLPGGKTLPPNFSFRIEEHVHNSIKKDMKLEVVDKNLISVVRSAVVTDVVGGRLHIKYAENELEDEGFWCHERSPLIHPVGWAQIIGHALKASPEYARQSLKKTLYRTFNSDDATWDLFIPVYNPKSNLKFKKGMKLEAIDPLNLSTICVATVTEVLRHNYLMIGIDGMMAANGSDWFCYHASSPCIFPVGFCESHDIKLTPPRGYKGDFKWSEYLKKTKSAAAPVGLFHREIPDHGFKEGMYLEAVDLMEPRLICVAYVTKVVGRLLKVHFDGWEDDYDQWCDCESPDLFPIGWCDVLGYRLEPPRIDMSLEVKKKKNPPTLKRRKRRHWSKKPNGDDSPEVFADNDASSKVTAKGKKTEQNESKTETTELVEKPKRGRPPKSKSNSTNNVSQTQVKKKSPGRSNPVIIKSNPIIKSSTDALQPQVKKKSPEKSNPIIIKSSTDTPQAKKNASLEKNVPKSTAEKTKSCAKKLTYEEENPIPGPKFTKTRKKRNVFKTPAIVEIESDSSSSSFDVSAHLGDEWENFKEDDK